MLQPPNKPYRRSPGELRAMGFHLADILTTKAEQRQARTGEPLAVALAAVIKEEAGE